MTSLKGSPASKMEEDLRETGEESTCTDEKEAILRSATDENSAKTRIGEELEKTEAKGNTESLRGEVTSSDEKTGKMVAPTIETEVPLDEDPETIREKQETEKSYPPSFK